MMTLPQELQDKIFLMLDYESLSKTRLIQSEYVKKCTHYSDINDAALNGNLENMKWLKQKGCPWDTETFKFAAKNGNLDNMKWLRQQGCPWGSNLFEFAALNGSLKNIRWLEEEGCPWDALAFYNALSGNNLSPLKFLQRQRVYLE